MATKQQSERLQRQRKSMLKRKKAVSSVTPGRARVPEISPARPSFEKDIMDPITSFWNESRLQLLTFRASLNSSSTADQKAAALQALQQRLQATEQTMDPNHRTSPYNLPSLYQEQMDGILSKTMYLANKWLADGMPVVPNV